MSELICPVCDKWISLESGHLETCPRGRIAALESALAASEAKVKALEGERDAALGVGDGFRNETYELRARAEAAESRVRVLRDALRLYHPLLHRTDRNGDCESGCECCIWERKRDAALAQTSAEVIVLDAVEKAANLRETK